MIAQASATYDVLHRVPGRMRLRVAGMSPARERSLEKLLLAVPGVRSARAQSLTESLVVQFDSQVAEKLILEALASGVEDAKEEAQATGLPKDRLAAKATIVHDQTLRSQTKVVRRARVAFRGLDRDRTLSKKVRERLSRHQGVRVEPNPLTGRVLIEFDEKLANLEDILSDLSDLELPAGPGEDNPTHPLDKGPLIRSSVRAAGALVGLSFLGARKLLGAQEPVLSNPLWGYFGGLFGIAQGMPSVRHGLRRLLGVDGADLAMSLPDLALGAVNGAPLSLVSNGAGAARLLTTVVARRESWRRYEERVADAPSSEPGDVVRLESGEFTTLPATVIEGTGSVVDLDGFSKRFEPGMELPAGSRLHGNGPFILELSTTDPFDPGGRSTPPQETSYEHYQKYVAPVSLGAALISGLFHRSPGRALEALAGLSPRAAGAGREAANLAATSKVISLGVTVVGTRADRPISRPDCLIIESPRVVVDGLEVESVSTEGVIESAQILEIAIRVSMAAGSPWGELFPKRAVASPDGEFDGQIATAELHGHTYLLELQPDEEHGHRARGLQSLRLYRRSAERRIALGTILVRPKISDQLPQLIKTCSKNGIELVLLASGDAELEKQIWKRANIHCFSRRVQALEEIRRRQELGQKIAYLSDSATAAAAFEQCDMAIAISSGARGRFPSRADLLAPDLGAAAGIIQTGVARDKAVKDSVALSIVSNLFGLASLFTPSGGIIAASRAVHVATLASYGSSYFRLRTRKGHVIHDVIPDPRPEHYWGRRDIEETLKLLGSAEEGLTHEEARHRRKGRVMGPDSLRGATGFLKSLWSQVRSPMVGLLGIGGALAFAANTPVEFVLVLCTLVAFIGFGMWQEGQVEHASQALSSFAARTARVMRGGQVFSVPVQDLVVGDVILLSHGDRVPADARLIDGEDLEIDEAALTGESFPVSKSSRGPNSSSRVVLEGGDVTVGHGRAVVVAIGSRTRMGTIAASLAREEEPPSPLNDRLGTLLKQFLPITLIGGLMIFAGGVFRGEPLTSQLILGATAAIAAIPEGLPLLAGIAQVAVSKRLTKRHAVTRRLSAVEALGRVDVTCTDKTGTLTEGRLTLSLVATADRVASLDLADAPLSEQLRNVLLSGALASPHPDSLSANAHQTDVAVLNGALLQGLEHEVKATRVEESPFESKSAFHSARLLRRLVVKGAPETLIERCSQLRTEAGDVQLDSARKSGLAAQAEGIALRGFRVLMVAEGSETADTDDPKGLVALGFLGIVDPLREGVPESVARCRDAGIRVIMLTGDHPATARAIAVQAGIADWDAEVLLGSELSTLGSPELGERLSRTSIVARVTPMDKLRIVEELQNRGHTVAMTGDGVNDAPALRLADVGVAMGLGGTEVARQVADLVLANDDFSTLVEALVEGRAFWRNIRRSLALLLGGNVGELALIAVSAAFGLPMPLQTRHILAMNLLTDGLPAFAVAFQEPENRNLDELAREGTSALEKPLQRDVMRRGISTFLPAFLAYVFTLRLGPNIAQTVAFATAICSQLTQTLDSGQVEGGLSKPVIGAVGSAFALLFASLAIPALRSFLALSPLSVSLWILVGAASACAPLLGRCLTAISEPVPRLQVHAF